MAPQRKRSSTPDPACEANAEDTVRYRLCAFFLAHPVLPSVHARSARVGIGERESRRAWGQQLVVRGQLHLPSGKLVMRVARVGPKRARCLNWKGTSFHVVLELEHVKPVDQRSAIRKADAVLPAFARAGQRHDTLKRVAQRGRCRLLYLFGVKHVTDSTLSSAVHTQKRTRRAPKCNIYLNKQPPADGACVVCVCCSCSHSPMLHTAVRACCRLAVSVHLPIRLY